MIIIRLHGGLGNQMFQYQFGCLLQQMGYDVYMDSTEYDAIECHNGFEVEDIFQLSFPKATRGDIIRLSNYIPIPFGGKIGKRLFKLSLKREDKRNRLGYKGQTCIGDSIISDYSYDELRQFCKDREIYFNGYWAEKHYSDWCTESLKFRESYIENYRSYSEQIDSENGCSVHIRRGDYVGTALDVCDVTYYCQAMEWILKVNPDTIFYVFSNNENEARELISKTGLELDQNKIQYINTMTEKSAGVDLWLMSLCHHNIIANSTYSYWGARLNMHTDKAVVVPSCYEKFAWDACHVIGVVKNQ